MKEFILKSIEACVSSLKKAGELAKLGTAAAFKEAATLVKIVMSTLDMLTKAVANLTGVDATVIKGTLAALTVAAGVIYNTVKNPPAEKQPPVENPPVENPVEKPVVEKPKEDPPTQDPPEKYSKNILFSTDSYKQCISENMPNYINVSMTWGGPSHMGALPGYKAISPPALIVTVAGNNAINRPHLDPHKVKGSKEFGAIIVGSIDFRGDRSSFSQQGEEVTIMAPSNRELTSADKNGNYKRFSGTSGAAPLVTGALGGFTLLSGYQPTAAEAKLLLKKTAIPIRTNNEKPQKNGPGMLNAYKLGMVGKKLRQECGTDIACFKRLIGQDSTYEFPEEEGVMETVKRAFPECSTTENQCRERSNSCEDKSAAFETLRKALFLNPSSDKEKWRYLSCIYSSSGLGYNAQGAKGIYDALLGTPPPQHPFERNRFIAGDRSCQSDDDCKLSPACHTIKGVPTNLYYLAANKDYKTECEPLSCNGNCQCDSELEEPGYVYTVHRFDSLSDFDKDKREGDTCLSGFPYLPGTKRICLRKIKASRAICFNSQCVPYEEVSSATPEGGSGIVK
ncbi:MAG: S8 family serine peptidase [Bdellovibrionales bacterium]|nr:S8 family serine peptidase [Bdellovibrionales bacterium]